jgi:thiamine biosynthesis protein ThiS
MHITLNGKAREVVEGLSVQQLLAELRLQPARVAVQVNLDIIKRERYADVILRPGDTVEVLTFMAGGRSGS